jgi:inosose dehydratase
MMNKIKLAIAPIGWSNDDLPALGGHISFEQCIQEMATAEYEGCEVGHKFPRDTQILQSALSKHKLQVASAWYSTYFTEERESETIEGFKQHMQFLKTMGAKVIVVCECGHSIQGQPLGVLANKPAFNTSQWAKLINGLHHLGKLAHEQHMQIVYHHHMGTGIQQENEIDQLMQETDPDLVSLLLDTGHLCFAGHDPFSTLSKHLTRIKHVHLKDIRSDVLEEVKKRSLSFLDAVKMGVFTVPGDGCIDFSPIFQHLIQFGYQGWWVVEAEQDPDKANPLDYAKKARAYVRKLTGM